MAAHAAKERGYPQMEILHHPPRFVNGRRGILLLVQKTTPAGIFHVQSAHAAHTAPFYGNTAQFGKKPQPGFLAQFKVWKAKEYCMYFSFFKLKKWGKKTAAARRHNCAVLPEKIGKNTLAFFVKICYSNVT